MGLWVSLAYGVIRWRIRLNLAYGRITFFDEFTSLVLFEALIGFDLVFKHDLWQILNIDFYWNHFAWRKLNDIKEKKVEQMKNKEIEKKKKKKNWYNLIEGKGFLFIRWERSFF